MSEDQKQTPKQDTPKQDVPAHSTEDEKRRLKDFNKGGIPPGSC